LKSRLLVAVGAGLVSLLVPVSSARAEAPSQEIGLVMGGQAAYDVAFLAGAATFFFVGRYALEPREGDRAPLGRARQHAFHRRADAASDGLVVASIVAFPTLAFLLDPDPRRGRRERWVLALRVPIVVFEAFTMAISLTTLVKNVGVCRPYAWDEATRTCGDGTGVPGDAAQQRRSFPSGHATNTGAVAGALLGLWLLPSTRSRRLALPALGASIVALTTAALRVRAGAHSITDMTTGLLTSSAIGLATAALHLRRSRRLDVSLTPSGLSLSGRF
jgi:membrane-associated phospholipid phosphatase